MTASIANGFGQILYEPDATECHVAPYAFHPMYDTAVARGTTWGAHTTNVGVSDEIGHFEYCDAINAAGAVHRSGRGGHRGRRGRPGLPRRGRLRCAHPAEGLPARRR